MKKALAMVLALGMTLGLVGCGAAAQKPAEEAPAATEAPAASTGTEEKTEVAEIKSEGVMTYDEYVAAALDTEVVVEAYVQAKQSWWDNKATVYMQDKDGGYFAYNMTCSEADYEKLVPGTKIKVSGVRTEWSGEIELAEGATFEIVEGDTYIAPAVDLTDVYGTDDLVKYQNQFFSVKGMTVEAYDESGAAFSYKTGEANDDIYFKASLNGTTYELCIEYYLTGSDTDVYKACEALKVGDTIDIEGFLYWYEGPNPHVTSITVK